MKKYEVILRHDNLIILGHKINQIGVLPGVALIDLVYRTLKDVLAIQNTSLVNCLFHEAIAFQQTSPKKIRLIFDDAVIPNKVTIYSQNVNHMDQWVLNFEGYFVQADKVLLRKTIDIENIKKKSNYISAMHDIYHGLSAVGIVHDDFMRVTGEIYQSEEHVLLELALGTKARAYLDKFSLHPAMLDAATIGSILPIYQDIADSKHAYIPISIECFRAIHPLPSQCFVLIDKQEVFYLKDIMKASFSVYDSDGQIIIEVKNLVNKKIRNQAEQSVEVTDPILDTDAQLTSQGNEVREKLRNLLNEYITESVDIKGTESFYHLGLDSQSLINMVHKLEKMTGEQLYPTLLFEYNTVNKLSQYLTQNFPNLVCHTMNATGLKREHHYTNQSIDLLAPTWVEFPWPDLNNPDLLKRR